MGGESGAESGQVGGEVLINPLLQLPTANIPITTTTAPSRLNPHPHPLNLLPHDLQPPPHLQIRLMDLRKLGNDLLVNDPLELTVDRFYVLCLDVVDPVDLGYAGL